MNFLLDIILVLIVAKLLGGIFEKIGFVEILGAITAGFLLGPVFGLVDIANIEPFGEIGLILVLFLAGFTELKIAEVLKDKFNIIFTGFFGAVIPFGLGYLTGYLFEMTQTQSLFLGGILAATSVSISVGSLIDIGKINTKVGRLVLTSSIIDDIFALLILIFLSSFVVTSTFNPLEAVSIFLQIIVFALMFVALLYLSPLIIDLFAKIRTEEAEFAIAIALILVLSYIAQVMGLSSVIGAFLAGIMLSKISVLRTKISIKKFKAISLGFFVPFFFAWVGMHFKLNVAVGSVFVVVLISVALLGKVIAALFTGIISKMKFKESLALGVARMPRGEIALTVLIIGKEIDAISDMVFGATFLLIFVSTILTPLLLKPLMAKIRK